MRPDPIAYLTGRLSGTPYPSGIGLPGTGQKFTTSGDVEIWPGNTFVCHVARPSDAYDAMLEMQEALKTSAFGGLYTWLPAPSFHMTVFEGMSPGNAGTTRWPEDVPPTAARDEVTAELQRRTAGIVVARPQIRATQLFCFNGLTVTGRDAAAEAMMRAARETLRDATRIYPPDFDSYVFHITFGYLIAWLSRPTAEALVEFSEALYARFSDRLQAIPLDAAALCAFDSMHHFEPVEVLE